MKNIKQLLIIIVSIWLLGKCMGCGGSVESLYGTYIGIDKFGNKVEIELTSESYDETRKYAYNRSDNLIFKDGQGRWRDLPQKTVRYSWNLSANYVEVIDSDYNLIDPIIVIDTKRKKMYRRWGDYLDDRDGFPYEFTKSND